MNLFRGDCLPILSAMEAESMDSLVTDPPAGISFMGKAWDDDKGGRDAWIAWLTEVMRECHRVLKPGAHGLVWALPRTSHWTATALENSGFEIRDVVTHLFGTGFPKSMDISKAIDKAAGAERVALAPNPNARKSQEDYSLDGESGNFKASYGPITAPATEAAKKWQGYGTALKPASEHWILIRKPLSEKTVAANVLKHGTGGINIDASRIGDGSDKTPGGCNNSKGKGDTQVKFAIPTTESIAACYSTGRFPANLVLDEEAAAMLDEQSGIAAPKPGRTGKRGGKGFGMFDDAKSAEAEGVWPADAGGGASRFFYVAKASKTDRNRKARDAREQAPDCEVHEPDGLFGEACDTTRREGA